MLSILGGEILGCKYLIHATCAAYPPGTHFKVFRDTGSKAGQMATNETTSYKILNAKLLCNMFPVLPTQLTAHHMGYISPHISYLSSSCEGWSDHAQWTQLTFFLILKLHMEHDNAKHLSDKLFKA